MLIFPFQTPSKFAAVIDIIMPYVSGTVVKLSTVIIFIPSGVEGAWSSELSASKVIRERVLENYLGRVVCA